jgi:hypothetical protein
MYEGEEEREREGEREYEDLQIFRVRIPRQYGGTAKYRQGSNPLRTVSCKLCSFGRLFKLGER